MNKVLSIVLSLVMLLSMSITAFAAEPTIEDQINALSDEYGFETFDMDTQEVQTVLEFDSIEEFEEFIRAVEQPQTFDVAIDTSKTPQTRDLNDNHVTTKDKAEINVKGNYVLGVALEGFNIGLTIPGEWDVSLRIY